MKKLKISILALCSILLPITKSAGFCGFYVAKAGATLFNKTSQVIVVRDGNRSVITMSSDFQGNVKDFAMVVPVPEVLKRENIRVANRNIFDKLDSYSGPRLVEYHDQNPCQTPTKKYKYFLEKSSTESLEEITVSDDMRADYSVTIEASYTVGEYDILILSAKESDGLKRWLTDNSYQIPSGAEEVLEPYIKSNMKFFVVKVNLEKQKQFGFNNLRPLQIAFNSDKFMLPIRLGMANANSAQDMIVYGFSKKGRIETTNYRTVKVPSDRNIPEFIQPKFGAFYKDLFETAHHKEGQNAVFLEYAWDVSFNNQVKCDPCVGPPPVYNDLREAGVYWMKNSGGTNVSGDVFFTRLHVRYDRQHFPQDLTFQHTPNKQRFQGRYVMNHALKYNLSCDKANNYYKKVTKRREQELSELASLTGWDIRQHQNYVNQFKNKIKPSKDDDTNWFDGGFKNSFWAIFSNSNGGDQGPGQSPFAWIMSLSVVLLMSAVFVVKRWLQSVSVA